MTALGGWLRGAAAALQGVVFVAFPLLVFGGVAWLGARSTAIALGLLLVPGLVRAAAKAI